ncbi:hypothetical protein GA0074695_0759 [Micromonospora viridifaciens]|uniref:Uncharacterized protein n=1 Tax=Micromonospora viridifaciens TaxID=1881 RepID=A0A1C4URU7_MICVI|nr:hypothetical protein GA0074695_0759 [Micromonospora viridifaciens]
MSGPRSGLPGPPRLAPDAEVATLAALAEALARIAPPKA